MTLLVAGFIIGPSGSSIRSIISRSDATIYSNTEIINGKESRVFYLEVIVFFLFKDSFVLIGHMSTDSTCYGDHD